MEQSHTYGGNSEQYSEHIWENVRMFEEVGQTFVLRSDKEVDMTGLQRPRCDRTWKALTKWLKSKGEADAKPVHALRKSHWLLDGQQIRHSCGSTTPEAHEPYHHLEILHGQGGFSFAGDWIFAWVFSGEGVLTLHHRK